MIAGYTDHAANERTFLARVRTGIAVIAFGFLIEKFNLFMLTVVNAALMNEARRAQLGRLTGGMGHYDGLVLIFGGLGIVVLATVRFIRTTHLLDDAQTHSAKSVRTELVLAACLVLIVTSYSIRLAFG